MSACDLFQDVSGLCGPDEGLWVIVVAVDVFCDGGDELFKVLEYAAPLAGMSIQRICPIGESEVRRALNLAWMRAKEIAPV